MHAFLRIAVLILPISTFAAGYTSIEGQLGGGREVIIDTEPPMTMYVWRRTKAGALVDTREYKNHGCELNYDYRDSEKEIRTLTCDGSSPIPNTKYVGRRFKGSCWKGDPEFLYTCVAGCGQPFKLPKTMRQNHWEC